LKATSHCFSCSYYACQGLVCGLGKEVEGDLEELQGSRIQCLHPCFPQKSIRNAKEQVQFTSIEPYIGTKGQFFNDIDF